MIVITTPGSRPLPQGPGLVTEQADLRLSPCPAPPGSKDRRQFCRCVASGPFVKNSTERSVVLRSVANASYTSFLMDLGQRARSPLQAAKTQPGCDGDREDPEPRPLPHDRPRLARGRPNGARLRQAVRVLGLQTWMLRRHRQQTPQNQPHEALKVTPGPRKHLARASRYRTRSPSSGGAYAPPTQPS
jgi:hypothetical protein